MPDAHIEEAFEVWWPKLDLQLQNLPSEEAKVQSHRSEKDILEEILSLVRNQNRPTSGLSALANPPFHRSLKVKEAKELAERVDREIELRASLEKALKKKVLQVTPLDAEYYLVEAEGSLFLTLKVPEGIPTTEVAGQVLSQIEKQVNIPSKDSSK